MTQVPENEIVKSSLIDELEPKIGFCITELSDEEIENIEDHEYDEIGDAIDKALIGDAVFAGKKSQLKVLPIGYDFWDGRNPFSVKGINKLLLFNKQILVPLGCVNNNSILDDTEGKLLSSKKEVTKVFLKYVRENHDYIKSGLIFPFFYGPWQLSSINKKTKKAIQKLNLKKLNLKASDIAPVDDDDIVDSEESVDEFDLTDDIIFEDSFESLYEKLFMANRWTATPVMTHDYTWNLWIAFLKNQIFPKFNQRDCKLAFNLMKLEFPWISELPKKEIIAIHNNSEAFNDWKNNFSIFMERITIRLEQGDDPIKAFNDEKMQLQEYIIRLQEEIKDSSFFSSLKKTCLNYELLGVSAVIHGFLNNPNTDWLDFIGRTSYALILDLFGRTISAKNTHNQKLICNLYGKIN